VWKRSSAKPGESHVDGVLQLPVPNIPDLVSELDGEAKWAVCDRNDVLGTWTIGRIIVWGDDTGLCAMRASEGFLAPFLGLLLTLDVR
jgi:hypothetical protein